MTKLKPYYQDEWATIYLGDCREIEERYCALAVERLSQSVMNLGAI